MRTHPLIALLVVATAITTVTVFGQSTPLAPVAPAKKPRHADALREARPAPPSAVPAWLVAPAASGASVASGACTASGSAVAASCRLRRPASAVASGAGR